MSNLRVAFCGARGCTDGDFPRIMLRQSLHRRALVLRSLIELFDPEYFALDRDLIQQVGAANSMQEVDNELRDFMLDTRNHRWIRMRLRLRVSTTRLRRIARRHLRPQEKAEGVRSSPAVPPT